MNIEELANRLKREGVEVFPVWDEDIARGTTTVSTWEFGTKVTKSRTYRDTGNPIRTILVPDWDKVITQLTLFSKIGIHRIGKKELSSVGIDPVELTTLTFVAFDRV